eukprot:jgi/Mesen1/10024/ME000073S09305
MVLVYVKTVGASRKKELRVLSNITRFKMPDHASCLERRLATYLRDTLRVPDPALVVFFWLRLRTWACILGWCLLAPIVQLRWELGPVYVIGTCFAIIFFNLGKKQEGDESAYSIFNEGFRELPGTLNADRIDRDIRAGQF